MTNWIDPEWADLGFPSCPVPPPGDPYWDEESQEDGEYCVYCGNGRQRLHAPWCAWQDVQEGLHLTPMRECEGEEG